MEQKKIRPARRVENIKEYYFSRKLKEVALLNAEGKDIISLGVGGPDLPPCENAIERLGSAARRGDVHSYQPTSGIAGLRKAYSDWYARWYGVMLDPATEIQPLIGSKEGILIVNLAFLNPGDGVLVPDPGILPIHLAVNLWKPRFINITLGKRTAGILISTSWKNAVGQNQADVGELS